MRLEVSSYPHVTLLYPKETSVLTALDLGYSEQEIYCCYEPGISGATLMERLCDFDTTLTDSIVALKQKCALEKAKSEKDAAYRALLEETKRLYIQTMCTICTVRKRTELCLPCGHLQVCNMCRSETCHVCFQHVDEYKHVFFS